MMRSSSEGFVVPLVAVALALLSLAIWSAADVSSNLNRRLEARRDRLRFETAAATAEARIAHLFLTEPLTQRAIRVGAPRFNDPVTDRAPAIARLFQPTRAPQSELTLDGRPYRLALDASESGSFWIEVQDEAGLLNLNSLEEAPIVRALELLGVAPDEARSLAAALADFTDADSLRRLNGAEASEYRRANRMAPRNVPLQSQNGLADVLGWARLNPRQRTRLQEMATTAPPSQSLNLNTAPWVILRAALGLDERAAKIIVKAREERTLVSSSDISRLAGGAISSGLAISSLPSRHIRITMRTGETSTRAQLRYRSRLILAPAGASRPVFWQRGWVVPVHLSAERPLGQAIGTPRELPASPTLFPARVRRD